jgi:hypothetical protein
LQDHAGQSAISREVFQQRHQPRLVVTDFDDFGEDRKRVFDGGFIITGLVSLTPHATSLDLQINAQMLILCRVLNQSCANVGAVAMSAGIALWSLDLLLDREARRLRSIVIVGSIGAAAGVLPAVVLILGVIHLDVPGMMHVLLLQAVWNIAVAAALIRSAI